MVISKRAGARKAGGAAKAPPPVVNRGIAKADWREGFKKPQAGVSDMTLLTQITNEAINDNLHKRFANGEIYVRMLGPHTTDIYRQCAHLCEPLSRPRHLY